MGKGSGEWLRVGTVVGTEEGADDREEEEDMVKGRGNTSEGKYTKCCVDLSTTGYPGRALFERTGMSHPPG